MSANCLQITIKLNKLQCTIMYLFPLVEIDVEVDEVATEDKRDASVEINYTEIDNNS